MSTSTKEVKGKASKQATVDKDESATNIKGSKNDDLDQSVEKLGVPKKKLHTENGEKVLNPLDPDNLEEKPSKRREGKGRRRGKEEEAGSDSEYEGEEEEEDYLEDDGEITSEHSDRSGDFDLDEYLKFRETAPDYTDEENGGEDGQEGEEEDEEEEEEEEK